MNLDEKMESQAEEMRRVDAVQRVYLQRAITRMTLMRREAMADVYWHAVLKEGI